MGKKNNFSQCEAKKGKKKQKKNKKGLFGYQSFFWWVSKSPFLTAWPKKRAPKNTIKIGVSAKLFRKTDVRHETAIFGNKKTKREIPVITLFCLFFSLSTRKKHQNWLKPLFL